MDGKGSRRAHVPTSPLHRWHVGVRIRGGRIVVVQAKQKKKKQQYGPGPGGAADLDPALEAAYQQFGRALGEAPRETARLVQQKLGLEQEAQRPSGSQVRPAQQQRSQQRQVDEASYKKLERLFDMAMSDPMNDREVQPQALIRAKSRMAPSITDAQRRETLLELMENTLKPRTAAVSMGMDLIQPARPSTGQQVPKLTMPNGKSATAAMPSSSPEAPASTIPDLIMPRGKQASPVRPQSPGAASEEPVPEPAPPRAKPGPPPPLMQPRGRLEVQQATRLSTQLDALQQGLTTARAPVIEESKPKPAPQPVPELSRAPARPAPSVTESAQLPKAAAAAAPDSASGKSSSDSTSGRPAKPGAQRPAPESTPLPGGRQAPARPVQQAAETLQPAAYAAKEEEISTAASQPAAESRPLPELSRAPVRQGQQAVQTGNAASQAAASDAAEADRQAVARAESAATYEAPLPLASSPERRQQTTPVTSAPVARAKSQGSVAAERDLAEPDQAAPAAPAVAPELLPTPQRPNKPKTRAKPTGTGLSSATLQGAEASSSAADTSSTPATEDSEPQEASAKATPDPAELLKPSQAEAATQTDPPASGGSKRDSANPSTSTMPQEDGAGLKVQPAPPMALPKPALPAPQADQTGRDTTTGSLMFWKRVAQEAMASVQKLPGKAIGASYGGVMVQTDAGVRGFLPFAQMLPARQQQIRQSLDARGLQEDLEVAKLRQAFAETIEALVVSQRVDVYVLSCKVIESPYTKGKLSIRNIFSEVTSEINISHTGPTKPPSAAAAQILQGYLGQLISGAVAHVTDRYAILNFEVDLENGKMERVPGLLHSDVADIADVVEGQVIEAVLEAVTTDARGLTLSGKGVRPPRQRNDLQQTIEDVVSGQSTAKERMGTLPAVELLCQALTEQEGILETTPGRRLQGTAFAPEIQVFLSKSDSDAEAKSGNGTAQKYTLLARSGNEVQEVEVLASLSREAMKSALSAALTGVIQYAS